VTVFLNLYSRRAVSWSMSRGMTAHLATDVLMMALWRRGKPESLMHRSDLGSQYASESSYNRTRRHSTLGYLSPDQYEELGRSAWVCVNGAGSSSEVRS